MLKQEGKDKDKDKGKGKATQIDTLTELIKIWRPPKLCQNSLKRRKITFLFQISLILRLC